MRDKQTLVLIVNAGSSSVKLTVWSLTPKFEEVASGSIEKIGQGKPELTFAGKTEDISKVEVMNHAQAANLLYKKVAGTLEQQDISVVAHRIVSGGEELTKTTELTKDVIQKIESLSALHPLHIGAELGLVDAFSKILPKAKQLACFDTAFSSSLPTVAKLLPIPRKYYEKGVRRYGFHGLAYQEVLVGLRKYYGGKVPAKIIAAHLGNGVSLAAILNGNPIDTTMSFTPASGIPMSSRSGDLDPGILMYLQRLEGFTPEALSKLINEESGLLGMSELSSDMKVLLEQEDEDQKAHEAVDVFCYQVKKTIGAYAAALGGVDAIVFSGGMGENAPKIRARVCQGLEYLGVKLGEHLNKNGEKLISDVDSGVDVFVLRVDEAVTMAEEARTYLNNGGDNESKKQTA